MFTRFFWNKSLRVAPADCILLEFQAVWKKTKKLILLTKIKLCIEKEEEILLKNLKQIQWDQGTGQVTLCLQEREWHLSLKSKDCVILTKVLTHLVM
jgi:hypothetical protein